MKTENSLLLFSVSITHNSKIKELSDGNRVMETELSFGQTTFLLWVPPFLSYKLWKLRIELWKLLIQTGSKVLSSWGVFYLGFRAWLKQCRFEFSCFKFSKNGTVVKQQHRFDLIRKKIK